MSKWHLKLHLPAGGEPRSPGAPATGTLRATRDRKAEVLDVDDNDRLHVLYRTPQGQYGGELLLTAEGFAQVGRASGVMSDRSSDLVLPPGRRDGAVDAIVELIPGEKLGGLAIRGLARALEAKAVGGQDRLVHCSAPHGVPADADAAVPAGNGHALVLVHGTAASTRGSFGDLSRDPLGSPWNAITKPFEDRTWAFQHASLTSGPLDNAVALATSLQPLAGQPLTLLSQSRGGMVVELLALAGELDDDDVRRWRRRAVLRAPSDQEVERLNELRALAKDLNIHRVVRVAAPITGTTLLADRLDAWLNVGLNGLGFLLSAATAGPWVKPAYGLFKDFAQGAVGARYDHESLPGLEAMIPGSPVSVLLGANKPARGELIAIAGDARRPGFWGRLKHVVPRAFFGGANDLVVDTAAMVVGRRRDDQQTVWHRQSRKEDRVWHLSYFGSERVRQDLTAALNPSRPFRELDARREGQRGPLGYVRDAALGSRLVPSATTDGSRPVVFLVPGVMGSELHVLPQAGAPEDRRQRLWIDPARLSAGGMKKLSGASAEDTLAWAALEGPYARIVTWLGQDCNVRVFPYDWRRPLEDAAKDLARAIQAELDRHGRPVAILAHSMGGLVSRLVFAQHKGTWNAMTRRGGRLVMLGTPNHGAPGVLRLLVGEDPSFQRLAFFDSTSTTSELLECVWDMPGVIQMLPDPAVKDPEWKHTFDWASQATWRGMRGGRSKLSPLVTEAHVEHRARLQRDLAHAVDPATMRYVAGRCSDGTPYEVVVQTNGNKRDIQFETTLLGDGSVPYRYGELRVKASPTAGEAKQAPGDRVPMWVVDATHGALADHRRAFPAYKKLLFGDTNCGLEVLTWDGSRTDRVLLSSMRSPMAPLTPPDLSGRDVPGWLDSDMGDGERTLHVEVRLGDVVLTAPDLPVIVPVAEGLRLSGPAAHLDCALDQAISTALRQGSFTGAHGEVHPVDLPAARPNGPRRRAVLMGVGDWSQTHAGLVGPLRRALLLAAQMWGSDDQGLAVRIPPLASGVRGVDWLDAAVEGAIAAQRARIETGGSPGVDQLLLVELDEALAVELYRHAQRAERQPPITLRADERIAVAPTLQREALPFPGMEELNVVPVQVRGLQTGRAERPVASWQLASQRNEGEALTFEVTWTTGRARAQIQTRTVVRRVVRSILASDPASGWSAPVDPGLEAFLLRYHLPLELRSTLATSRDIQLSVDSEAARVPWEVLLGRESDGADGPGAKLGLLRTFRELAGHQRTTDRLPTVANGRALVLGPPVLPGMAELPGAEREADAVERALAGFAVTRLSVRDLGAGLNGAAVRRHLCEPWEVLHLAGHGQYVAGAEDQSGFLLPQLSGGPDVLSGLDLRALEGSFPALVFVNACHGGGSSDLDRPGHAASLARACIDLGARAVVAAGWAIDDAAAEAFADRFYDAVARGVPFGEAVAAGRVAAAQAAPGDMTWAAYQCYGDASFVLPSARTSGRRKWLQLGGVGHDSGPPPDGGHLDVVESEVIDAVAKLQILTARHAAGVGCDAPETLGATLEVWESLLAPALLSSPQVALALGTAWLRLQRAEPAVSALERAANDPLRPVMFDRTLESCRQLRDAGRRTSPQGDDEPSMQDVEVDVAAPERGFSIGTDHGDAPSRLGAIVARGIAAPVKVPKTGKGVRGQRVPTAPRLLIDEAVSDIVREGKFERVDSEGVRIFVVSAPGGQEPVVLRVVLPPDASGRRILVTRVGATEQRISRDDGSPILFAPASGRVRAWWAEVGP